MPRAPEAPPPPSGYRLPLRLSVEQVARLVARQAVGLDILGLPPAVSLESAQQEAVGQIAGLARKQREGTALRRQKLALRQAIAAQETRRIVGGRREEGGGSEADSEAEGGESQAEAEAEAEAAAEETHQLSAAEQLLHMQRMLHTNAVVRAEEAIEQAEVRREMPQDAARSRDTLRDPAPQPGVVHLPATGYCTLHSPAARIPCSPVAARLQPGCTYARDPSVP